MLKRLLAIAFFICATAASSKAVYVVQSHLESVALEPAGPCVTVLVQVFEQTYYPSTGQTYDKLIGSSRVKIGPGCGGLVAYNPNQNCPPFTFHAWAGVTTPESPSCAGDWLFEPLVDAAVFTQLNNVLDSIQSTGNKSLLGARSSANPTIAITATPNPARNVISIRTVAENLDAAKVLITDISGKTMEGSGNVIAGPLRSHVFTMTISTYPPGVYIATLVLKNGQKVSSRFTVQ